MSTDERIRDLLREVTPRPEMVIDVDEVRARSRRRTSRRAVLASGLGVVVAAGTAGVLQSRDRATGPAPGPRPTTGTSAWRRVADLPLTPRWDPLAIWTGTEALVVGGLSRTFVGGPAPVPELTDGAAFDPEAKTWRAIADAPYALGTRSVGPSLVVGDTVVVAELGKWLAYDVPSDAWSALPPPPRDIPQPVITADVANGLVYAVDMYVQEGDGAPVQVLDLGLRTWSALPLSTHEPRLDSRSLAMTDVGLVLVGDDVYPRQAGDGQESSRAELWNGIRWSRFPDSTVNGSGWVWTGQRVISTYRVTERDSNSDGRHGFRAGALDPATGSWSALPWLPGHADGLLDGGWPETDGELVFGEGYLYDDADQTSQPVTSPTETLGASGVVLAGGRVMTFGGFNVDPGQEPSRVTNVTPTSEAWVLDVG